MKNVLFLALLLASAAASAQAPAVASSGDYLQDFDRMITEIRGVEWSVEFCGGTFPEKKAANDAAYAEWRTKNAKLIAEMEDQFNVLDKYLDQLSQAERGGVTAVQYKQQVESRRASMREHFVELGLTRFAVVCGGLPELLRSPKFDFEVSRAALLETIRKGPLQSPQALSFPQVMPPSPAPSERKQPSQY